jgi:heavy metal sensor kinase
LLLALPVLLLIASAGGYWLSRRALDPVDQVARAAQRISIENLTARLPVAKTGDQLQRLSETLNQMFSRLEASVNSIKRFTADASHELRAPITLIRTTAEVAVQNRQRPAEEYLAALDDIAAESERTSQLVESLMLLARADADKQAVERTLVDLVDVCRIASEQGQRLALQHGLELSVELPSGPVLVQADADAVRRAVLVLIDNAVKYTPAGGRVTVALAKDPEEAMVTISDTGMGIRAEELPHIFERFWRADKARSRAQGGAGLGLSIAEWIAEVHGGSIQAESRIGEGSVFRFRLPLAVST